MKFDYILTEITASRVKLVRFYCYLLKTHGDGEYYNYLLGQLPTTNIQ